MSYFSYVDYHHHHHHHQIISLFKYVSFPYIILCSGQSFHVCHCMIKLLMIVRNLNAKAMSENMAPSRIRLYSVQQKSNT